MRRAVALQAVAAGSSKARGQGSAKAASTTKSSTFAATAAKVHAGPSTRLPFLQNIVRKASTMPRTTGQSPPYRPYPITAASTVSTASAGGSSSASASPLYLDERCVLVKDAYPKSTVHCLVMPLSLDLVSLASLEAQHVPLLRHMVSVADGYARYLKELDASRYSRLRFITGFHALPSLPMLHLHLLSMDLDSPCLKTKKHYNSFATFFFLTSDRVIADVEQHGKVTINADAKMLRAMESQDMKCMWCGAPLANVPQMKAHLSTCEQSHAYEL